MMNVAADDAVGAAALGLAGELRSNEPMKLTAFLTFSFAQADNDQ